MAASVYTKRPRVGEILVNGRYGDVRVDAVLDNGRRLYVRDRLEREHEVERSPQGSWVRGPRNAFDHPYPASLARRNLTGEQRRRGMR